MNMIITGIMVAPLCSLPNLFSTINMNQLFKYVLPFQLIKIVFTTKYILFNSTP